MLDNYLDFITKFNVLGLAIGFIIAANLKDVASDIIDDILMPFVNPILNYVTKGNGINLNIPGTSIKINLERVFSSGVKFLCLSLIIFVMIQFGVKLRKPVQWVSVRNWHQLPRRGKSKNKK